MTVGTIWKYNPAQIKKEEFLKTFSNREEVIEKIIQSLEMKPPGHSLIIGPRGFGKTSVLIKTLYEVEGYSKLAERFIPVLFPEEEFYVYDPASFCRRILEILGKADPEYIELGKDARKRNLDPLEVLKEIAKREDGSFLILADNFDYIVDQVLGARGQAEGAQDFLKFLDLDFITIVGSALRAPEKKGERAKIWNRFQFLPLEPMRDFAELIKKRAENNNNFEILCDFASFVPRIKILGKIAGGNLRIAHLLYNCLESRALSGIIQIIDAILDELTPLYKEQFEGLEREQRRILDAVIRRGGSATVNELVVDLGTRKNIVKPNLEKLSKIYFLEKTDRRRQKSTIYQVTPPIFQIWYEMRYIFEEKSRYLLTFFEYFSTAEEIKTHIREMEKALGKKVFEEERLLRNILFFSDLLDTEDEYTRELKFINLERFFYRGKIDDALKQIRILKEKHVNREEREKVILDNLLLAECYAEKKDYDRVGEMLREAEEIYKKIEPNPTIQARFYNLMGEYSLEQGNLDEAVDFLEKSQQVSAKIPRPVSKKKEKAHSLSILGRVEAARLKKKKALKLFEEAAELNRESGNLSGLADCLVNIGGLMELSGKFEEALKKFGESAETQSRIGNERGEASVYKNIASLLDSQGKYQEAIGYYKKAIELESKLKLSREMISTLSSIAFAYFLDGDYERSLETFKETLEYSRVFKLPEERDLALISVSLGYFKVILAVLFEKKDENLAMTVFEESLGYLMKLDDDKIAGLLINNFFYPLIEKAAYEFCLRGINKVEIMERESIREVLKPLKVGIEILENRKNRDEIIKNLGPLERIAIENVLDTAGKHSDFKKAFDLFQTEEYRKATVILERIIGEFPDDRESFRLLSECFIADGDYESAELTLEDLLTIFPRDEAAKTKLDEIRGIINSMNGS